MNPPVLPWHKKAAEDITGEWHAMTQSDIAAMIARHDPHAAQHAETVRLLRRAAAALYAAPYPEYEKLSDEIRAHLAALNAATAERDRVIAELREDKARLDWLDSFDSDNYWNDYANPGTRGKLRQRIDAARTP
jgi:hypothetical protein